VRRALARLASAPGIGGRLLARVIDVRTGQVLYDRAGATPAAPASTAKLLTAAAILAVRPATYRFTTTVESGGPGTVVLVGGGDPTLSPARPGTATRYPGAARISDLAAQLAKQHIAVRHIVVDGSLFSGPSVAPSWDPADMGTNYGAPITAVVADAAQQGPEGSARSTEPDLAAGADLAAALGQRRIPVSRGTASDGAKTLATVRSAPLSELIPEMLLDSDNVIADILARQVAVATHRPASFTGATAAIRAVLGRFGVPVGDGMKDGSGLSSADRVSPAALVAVLRLMGGAGPADAAPLRFVVSALPVAGWSGTLEARFTAGSDRSVAGRVRAKTGTLSTVSSLAGLVQDRSGRLLAFSFDADRAVGTIGAEAALDALVTALGHCGCR
jgi:D-alanyl-D-alanine carboxypeptidase/D-alanyl-D-alanine-endopeptidase (penicillin-binding protein 4)